MCFTTAVAIIQTEAIATGYGILIKHAKTGSQGWHMQLDFDGSRAALKVHRYM
jgi:hypothetical protein